MPLIYIKKIFQDSYNIQASLDDYYYINRIHNRIPSYLILGNTYVELIIDNEYIDNLFDLAESFGISIHEK